MAARITPTGNRLYVYEGTEHKSLTSGQSYTMKKFAEVISVSPQTIQSRFRHRRLRNIVRDCDLFPLRSTTPRCRMIEYSGNHPDLVSGESYSYVSLGRAFNITTKLIRDRMRGSRVFTDDMALDTALPSDYKRCETRSTKTMNKWLRRKIV